VGRRGGVCRFVVGRRSEAFVVGQMALWAEWATPTRLLRSRVDRSRAEVGRNLGWNDAEAKAELKSEPIEAKAVGSRSPAEGGAQAKGSEPKPRKRRSCVRPS